MNKGLWESLGTTHKYEKSGLSTKLIEESLYSIFYSRKEKKTSSASFHIFDVSEPKEEIKEQKMSEGALMIVNERTRQINRYGHNEVDFLDGTLAKAGSVYAIPEHQRINAMGGLPAYWPISSTLNYKSRGHDRIKELAVAGAFIAAEIDKLLNQQEKQEVNTTNEVDVPAAAPGFIPTPVNWTTEGHIASLYKEEPSNFNYDKAFKMKIVGGNSLPINKTSFDSDSTVPATEEALKSWSDSVTSTTIEDMKKGFIKQIMYHSPGSKYFISDSDEGLKKEE